MNGFRVCSQCASRYTYCSGSIAAVFYYCCKRSIYMNAKICLWFSLLKFGVVRVKLGCKIYFKCPMLHHYPWQNYPAIYGMIIKKRLIFSVLYTDFWIYYYVILLGLTSLLVLKTSHMLCNSFVIWLTVRAFNGEIPVGKMPMCLSDRQLRHCFVMTLL